MLKLSYFRETAECCGFQYNLVEMQRKHQELHEQFPPDQLASPSGAGRDQTT